MQSRFFSQFEYEKSIYAVLEHDDETHIASGVGKSPSMLSQYLNPECERESPCFKSAAIFAEWIYRHPERGQEALRRHIAFISRAIPGMDSTPEGLILAAVSKVETELKDVRAIVQTLPGVEWSAEKDKKPMRREVERKKEK